MRGLAEEVPGATGGLSRRPIPFSAGQMGNVWAASVFLMGKINLF
jgi:hypothetical protein